MLLLKKKKRFRSYIRSCARYKCRVDGNIAMSQVNRTCTLNKALGVADMSELLKKSMEENTL